MSDNIAVMNKGRFDQIGTAKELYYEPANAFVAGFVGDANKFTGKVTGVDGPLITITTDGGAKLSAQAMNDAPAIGGQAQIFVRPEAIALSKSAPSGSPNISVRVVDSVLFNGANSMVLLRDPQSGDVLQVTLPQTGEFLGLGKGDSVFAHWDPTQARCFATGAA
jgi:spermidine/putrescine transport system ATP-binding protein